MVIIPYDGGRLSLGESMLPGFITYIPSISSVRVCVTVKRYLTAILLGNSDKRIKSLMHMMLVAVHTKYLDALCICDSYRFVVGKVTVSLYE